MGVDSHKDSDNSVLAKDVDSSQNPSDSSLLTKRKILIAFAGVFVLVILIVGTVLFLSPTPEKKITSQESIKNTSQQSTANNSQTQAKEAFNPLISNEESKRIQKAYNKSGQPLPTYNFQYHLSPKLLHKTSSLLIQSADAAGICDIANAPSTITVYTLKNDYAISDALMIADEYALGGTPASIPTDNGSSYQYYFSNPDATAFLAVTASSGVIYFHVAPAAVPASPSATITQEQAQEISTTALKTHHLDTNLKFLNDNPSNGTHIFTYTKDYGLKVIDSDSLKSLDKTQSVCDTLPATTMNQVITYVSSKGNLWKLINNTRKVTGTYKLPRENLSDALIEYKDSPLVLPIVYGSPTIKTGDVTIDQVSLVNYDYGDSYAQVAYVPMYLTSGLTASGTRVVTLFPAITKEQLGKTPILDLVGIHRSEQMDTFNPPPPASPAPPKGNACTGGLVDYDVICKNDSGQTICRGAVSLDSKQYDPMGVCHTGCQKKSASITVSGTTNACSDYMNQNSLPVDKAREPSGNFLKNSPAGTYTCEVRGCPC